MKTGTSYPRSKLFSPQLIKSWISELVSWPSSTAESKTDSVHWAGLNGRGTKAPFGARSNGKDMTSRALITRPRTKSSSMKHGGMMKLQKVLQC
ncbi:unnamed protein product [Chondrus crispus]|uniref:Uncharacterized protein n=1 Tax=Chondrus crispus TaxID=2769 RepID=R7QPZ5_CHOCR|nr:unnamed protein product [Chondrus crispus]CDF40557.1 unnamed protein product [Chondrus crispus]|eukprot:XP_005710851.1 unnamed protein product [Chondrus crispus]